MRGLAAISASVVPGPSSVTERWSRPPERRAATSMRPPEARGATAWMMAFSTSGWSAKGGTATSSAAASASSDTHSRSPRRTRSRSR